MCTVRLFTVVFDKETAINSFIIIFTTFFVIDINESSPGV